MTHSLSAVRIEARDEHSRLTVFACPGARRDAILGEHGDALKVAVSAPPEKGKANRRLIEVLAKALDLPRRAVRVIPAHSTSRRKTVQVDGLSPASIRQRIEAILEA